jgi:hypothetical protein
VKFERVNRALSLLGILVLFGLVAGWGHGAGADSAISVTAAPAVQNSFPAELVFTVSARDSVPITDVVLHYTLVPSTSSVSARADFTKGTEVQATYHMRSNGNPLYLPPGKQISYSWQFTDANGGGYTTDAATTNFADTRFQWQTVTSGNLSLSYYRGNNGDAMSLLNVGAMAIAKASDLEQAKLSFPVKAFVYASSQDFLPAAQKESKATDPGLLGQALTPDTVILVGGSLRSSDTQDTIRHELTHLVTGAAVQGPYQDLMPLWLNEGISVNAQSDPGDYQASVQQAIQSDSVVPIQVLESSRGVDVGLFYGESYALVKFLVSSGGPAKFSQLLAAVKAGKSMDQALQGVYGFDRTGLYNAWRDSVHLSGPGSGQGSGAASGASQPAAAAGGQPNGTVSPDTSAGAQRGGPATETSDRGSMVLLLTLGGALALMLLAAVVAFALVLSRRARSEQG